MVTSLPAPRSREPIFRHPWRAVVVVAMLLAVATLGAVLLDATDTSRVNEAPREAVESVNPANGEILQNAITADLRNDLTGVLVIDDVEVPEDQTNRVEELGQVSFRPGPGTDVVRFEPGPHTVTVLFWAQGEDRPAHPDRYTWTFRSFS